MLIRFTLIFLCLFSQITEAETLLKVFYTDRIILSENCYFIVRGGDENDFTCPTTNDPFRSISFPTIEQVEKSTSQSRVQEANKSAQTDNLDFHFGPVKSLEIDGKMHYLGEWELAGKSHQSYFVCDRRSCIKISAMEVDFVRGIIEQFSSKTLYDIE